jgi:hypothetical protein
MEPTISLSNNDGASPAAQDMTASPDDDAPMPQMARKCSAKPPEITAQNLEIPALPARIGLR